MKFCAFLRVKNVLGHKGACGSPFFLPSILMVIRKLAQTREALASFYLVLNPFLRFESLLSSFRRWRDASKENKERKEEKEEEGRGS